MGSRRRSVLLGTGAAVVALGCAVGAAAAVEAVRDEPAQNLDGVVRLGADDAAVPAPIDHGGEQVPEGRFTTLEGEVVTFADYAGTPLVVNFLASWCAPCADELPGFERVHRQLGDRVAFLGINPNDEQADVERLLANTGVTFDVGRDPDGALYEAFGVTAMPSTFLVTADGRIVDAASGKLDEDELRARIEEHLLSGAH